jgi:hypothetical protein
VSGVLGSLPAVVAGASLLILTAQVLLLACGPILTDDLWFHLAAGRAYLSEGPWPASDPMLHTAHESAPVQHEWLFGVWVYAIELLTGLQGLRVAHGLGVVAIVALAWSVLRRQASGVASACAATTAFVVLAWFRLFQLRPDLVSIPATLLLYRLLIEPAEPPGWRRVILAVALLVVWANLHSLFAIGLLLLVAAHLGLGLKTLAVRWAGARLAEPPANPRTPTRAARLGVAVSVGAFATLLNPRGPAQHLTFFTSSRGAAIWAVQDEWTHFNPFVRPEVQGLTLLAWLTTDLLLILFVVVAALGAVLFLRRPSERCLRAMDPVLLGLAAAAFFAVGVSIRFAWMGVFPLLFLLRAQRVASEGRPRLRTVSSGILAAAAVVLAYASPGAGGMRAVSALLPSDSGRYFSTPYVGHKYHLEGVRFLAQTGVSGKLFNAYWMGGFLGYWLAPQLRTFVDGRTEHYSPEVLQEYLAINRMTRVDGESYLDVLDRREVDLFFGVRFPVVEGPGVPRVYTTAHLEGAPGWILVFRAIDHAVYLRANARNRDNLRRIADYYQREGVPFDPQRGLDVEAVIRQRPDWAVEQAMLPPDHPRLLAALDSKVSKQAFASANRLGSLYTLLGAYDSQIALDRQTSRRWPRARAPRRRLVHGLLRSGQSREALSVARELRRLDPADARWRRFERLAALHLKRAQNSAAPPTRDDTAILAALVHRLPLFEQKEVSALLRGFTQRPENVALVGAPAEENRT